MDSNYNDSTTFGHLSADGTVLCRNGYLPRTMSLRFLGPLETTTPSISIYSGADYNSAGGTERTFTGLAANNFGFIPTAISLTGRSSWTGFANENFSGNSTCFSTSELVAYLDISEIMEIRSIVQGCM